MAGKRLSKAARREQLLDCAALMVRAEGTEALTLASLADRAGVSKPIAYEHFGTRDGLLIALYRHLDARRIEMTAVALKAGGETLSGAVGILAAAYIDCVCDAGVEFAQVAAALSANADLNAFHREQRVHYAEQYRRAFSAYVRLGGRRGQALLLGLIGGADALAREAAEGRMTRAVAVAALTEIMLGTLTGMERD